jgi:hypothetical protein
MLPQAPPRLVARIDMLLAAPHDAAFQPLHHLEGAVLELLSQHRPEVDLQAARHRRTYFTPG